MKINLSEDLTDDLTELKLIGGYESIQTALRMMVRLYTNDWKQRFSASPMPTSGTQQTNITQVTPFSAVAQPTTDPQAPQENPTPEW